MADACCVFLLLLRLCLAIAVRIPLDTSLRSSPFLQSTALSASQNSVPKVVTAPFTWSHMYLGKLLHQSHIIELGPRGALFLLTETTTHLDPISSTCVPSEKALCLTQSGEVLPSAVLKDGSTPPPLLISAHAQRIHDPVLRTLASVDDACKMENNGAGRVYATGGSDTGNYTVTACDVIQGTHVLVYEPRTRRLALRKQTLGPTAYLIILVSATFHISALASPPTSYPEAWAYHANCFLSIVACIAVYAKGEMHFYSPEDEALFWVTSACGLIALLRMRHEAYLFALTTITATVYRTHQTPYAPILGYVYGYMAWTQVILQVHHHHHHQEQQQHHAKSNHSLADLLLLLVSTTLFGEIAIRPFFVHTSQWPLQFVFHAFITYSLAKYKDLSSWLPTA